MGLRAAFLILPAMLLLLAPGFASGRMPSCRSCHPAHYSKLGTCVSCHRGDPRSTRLAVAHRRLIPARYAYFALPNSPVTERGRRHLQTAGCRRCHRLGGKGNRLAGDLDPVLRQATPEELAAAIRQPALLMPDFRFREEQRQELVNALLAIGRETAAAGKEEETGRVVYFAGRQHAAEDVFSRRCGSCHRLLSPVLGGLGTGKIGPNLSGLLTKYYPRFSRGQERWSLESLRKWLKNPRAIRPMAPMPPLDLTRQESAEILELLQAAPLQGP